MPDFVDPQQDGRHQPKGDHIQPGLVGEVIELQCVTPDLAPVRDEDPAGKGKGHEREHGKPRGVHEADAPVQPAEELVGIDGGEGVSERSPGSFFALQQLVPLVRCSSASA